MDINLFKWSRSTRITILTAAIFLIGVWSLMFYREHIQHQETEHLLADQQFSAVTIAALHLEQEIKERIMGLEAVAKRITPDIFGNAASLQAFLDERPYLESHFSGGLFVTRLDGTAIADIPFTKRRIGTNYSDRDYIAGAIKGGYSSIGMPVTGKMLKALIIGIATPIRDVQGTVIGALAGVIDLSKPNFLNDITDYGYGKTGGFLVVSPQRRQIVAATDKKRIMEKLPLPGVNPFIDRAIQGFEGAGITTTPQGVQVLASTKGCPTSGWYVAGLLPTAEAFAPIIRMQQNTMHSALLLTFITAALTFGIIKVQRIKDALADQAAMRTEELQRTSQHEQFQRHILEMLAGDDSLTAILEGLVKGISQLHPNMICKIFLLDKEGKHIGDGESFNLPDFYNAPIDGIEIGIGAGASGTAAFTGKHALVDDIAMHPYWAPFEKLTPQAGLGACWSQPILSSFNRLFGTFAIYHHEACAPDPSCRRSLENAPPVVTSKCTTLDALFLVYFLAGCKRLLVAFLIAAEPRYSAAG